MAYSYVYCAFCVDVGDYTKIGTCDSWVDRSGTYKTGYPCNSMKPYILIECPTDIGKYVERHLLNAYSNNSTTTLDNHSGGREWISGAVELNDVKDRLKIFKNIRFIVGEELTTYIANEERVERERYDKKEEDEKSEYDEYMKSLRAFPYELRGYQIEAYEKIKSKLDTSVNQKLKLYIMCRCGKTILFQKIAFDYYDSFDVIVYVCPRLSLLENMISRWLDIFTNVDVVELSSSGSDYCIDDNKLKHICETKTKTIIFVCNNSFRRLTQLIEADIRKMFIFDEVHYLARKKTEYNPILLMNNNIGPCLTVFATATPIKGNYLTNRSHIFMNDPEYFGNYTDDIVYCDIEDAIKNKFMVPASIVVGAYDLNAFADIKTRDEYSIRRDKSVTMLWNLLSTEVDYQPNKILMYANSVKSVNAMYELLIKDGRFGDANRIFKMTSSENYRANKNALSKFKENKQLSILINCYMVTDGIDIPTLDTVIFIDPRYNKAAIVQIISRPRSYYPNKIAHILIPQVYDNLNSAINDCGFDTVLNIIEELHRNNDPHIVKYIRDLNKPRVDAKERSKGKTETPMIHIDEKVKLRFIELAKARTAEKKYSLREAILHVLSDRCPRTANQIWDEIKSKELCNSTGKTLPVSCSVALSTFFREGKIDRQKIDNVFVYFCIKKTNNMTFVEFLAYLKARQILFEGEYRRMFQGCYTSQFPENPTRTYNLFRWSMLNNEHYTVDDCTCAILNIEQDAIKLIGSKYKTDHEKNEILHSMDYMIPPDMKKTYGISLCSINEKIFEQFDDF